jgi:hypothetical protein
LRVRGPAALVPCLSFNPPSHPSYFPSLPYLLPPFLARPSFSSPPFTLFPYKFTRQRMWIDDGCELTKARLCHIVDRCSWMIFIVQRPPISSLFHMYQ